MVTGNLKASKSVSNR